MTKLNIISFGRVLIKLGLMIPEIPKTPPVSSSKDFTKASKAKMLPRLKIVKLSLETLVYR